MIEWLLVGIAKLLLSVVGAAVLLPVVAWTAGGFALLHHGVKSARDSDESLWYHAGRGSVWARVYVRHPHKAFVAMTVAQAVVALTEDLGVVLDHASDGTQNGNPPPEVPPVQEANLRMPTTYPFERARHLAWPPFMGHRFAIGDRGA